MENNLMYILFLMAPFNFPNPSITLITPTGDRPEAFSLCEKYMERQSFDGDVQWIVVDDGATPTTTTLGQEYIRRTPEDGEGHTLTKNLLVALPEIKSGKVLFIEDDDWYNPGYVKIISGLLDEYGLVGEDTSNYYNVRARQYYECKNRQNASLCATGMWFNKETREILKGILQTDFHVDIALWTHPEIPPEFKHLEHSSLCVGIKGMPGRKGIGMGHNVSFGGYTPDPDLSKLQELIGEDVKLYEEYYGG